MKLFIALLLCQVIVWTTKNIDTYIDMVYGNIHSECVIVNNEKHENKNVVISELSFDEKYSIGSVNFHFEDVSPNANVTYKKIVFEKIDYEYNEYVVIGKVLRLKINGSDNYILWTHHTDNDVRVCEILELKDGKMNLYWQVSGTSGEVIDFKDNTFTFKEVMYTDIGYDDASIISNYKIKDNGVYQIGDYKIENCEYILIGHNLPAHIISEGKDKEIVISAGQRIKFTHSDFKSKLYFEKEKGTKGYLVVDRDDDFDFAWILSILKVNGVVLDEYFKGRIDDLARLGISKW